MIQTAITKMGTGIRITFTDGGKTERIYLSRPEFDSLVEEILKGKEDDKGTNDLGFC